MSNFTFADITYEDCRPVLNTLVDRFYNKRRSMFRKIGKDKDDLRSLANELFWKAYTSHDESLGPFCSRLTFVVWNGLMDRFATDYTTIRLRASLKDEEGDSLSLDYLAKPSRSRFNVRTLQSVLGPEAGQAVRMALYPPPAVESRAQKAGGSARNYRAAIRAYLMDELGFSAADVARCFVEIAEQLADFDPDSYLDQ